jgi:hypothetical protein
MTVQQVAPGTRVEIAHLISPPLDGGEVRWGFAEECGSPWHDHETAVVVWHVPGVTLTWCRAPGRREHTVDDHPGMWRIAVDDTDSNMEPQVS